MMFLNKKNKVLFKNLPKVFLIIALIFFSISSCDKKIEKKESFENTEYKINTMLYSKNYEKALKYIDVLYFDDKNNFNQNQKAILLFKSAEIKYLYLNDISNAYKEMKKIFKNKELKGKNYIKLLEYLVTISETSDYQNFKIFMKKLFELKKDKETLYKCISFLKKDKNLKKLNEIINTSKLISGDELILLKLDLFLREKKSEKFIFDFIDKSVKSAKNQKTIDKLNLEKIFLLEQKEKVDYKDLLLILNLIKGSEYKIFKKNKEKFYKNKILLYNKK